MRCNHLVLVLTIFSTINVSAQSFDASVNWDGESYYFFKGSEYYRFSKSNNKADTPKPIAGNWLGVWTNNINAAVNWGNRKIYFFKGSEFVSYDMDRNSVDVGYPQPIAGHLPGVWASNIDAAINYYNGKVYFF